MPGTHIELLVGGLESRVESKLSSAMFYWLAAMLIAALGYSFQFNLSRCDILAERISILSDRLSRIEVPPHTRK